jgi:hypothetical protein
MSETYAQQLDRVQAAIAALESGKLKRYSVGGQEFEYQDLPTLYARERRLLNLVNHSGQLQRRGVEF